MSDTTRAAEAALCFSEPFGDFGTFAEFAIDEAAGIMLAHSLRIPIPIPISAPAPWTANTDSDHRSDRRNPHEFRLRKGHTLTPADIAQLKILGIRHVMGARLATQSVAENDAASSVVHWLSGTNTSVRAPYGGRCNLHAAQTGLLVIDTTPIIHANRLDERIAIGTLPPWSLVHKGQVVATVKIITCGVPRSLLEACRNIFVAPPLRIAELHPRRAALISTELPGTNEKAQKATIAVTRQRLEALGSRLALELHCAHTQSALEITLRQAHAAGCDLILISGAAGTKDRRDLVPQAIVSVGGEIERFGTPVEPGNMLLLARIQHIPVLILPGCARSRRLNGLDWVLQRLLAHLPLEADEFAAMGIGGLIRHSPGLHPEPLTPSETGYEHAKPAVVPSPSDTSPIRPPHIAILVLAAGRSQRMGRQKLLEPFDGVPMVQRAVFSACSACSASSANSNSALQATRNPTVTVVLGSDAEKIMPLIASTRATCVLNPDYSDGLSTSLRRGIAALPPEADAVLVMLADMPHINAHHLDAIIAFYEQHAHEAPIVVPVHAGQRGNPILWSRRFFDDMMQLDGDQGARGLLERYAQFVRPVEIDDPAIFFDIDTPQDLLDATPKS